MSESSVADELAYAEARQTRIVNGTILQKNVTVRRNESVVDNILDVTENVNKKKRVNTSPLVSQTPKVQNKNKTPTQMRSCMEKHNISPLDDEDDFVDDVDDSMADYTDDDVRHKLNVKSRKKKGKNKNQH